MKNIFLIIFICIASNLLAQDSDEIQIHSVESRLEKVEQDTTISKRKKVITINFDKEALKYNNKRRKEKLIEFYDRQIEKHLERKETKTDKKDVEENN